MRWRDLVASFYPGTVSNSRMLWGAKSASEALQDTAGLPSMSATLHFFRSFLVDEARCVPPEPIREVISADLRAPTIPSSGHQSPNAPWHRLRQRSETP